MKKKFTISLILLIVSIICCGCGVETHQKIISNGNVPETSLKQEQEEDNSPIVYITKYGSCYHEFGCTHAKKIYIELTVKQATAKGYTACYYCCY